ncbi:MAG: hypothetical protein HY286_12305 [Planctomycetes bacterium]|nr:hypothetical protein [Planctomycetota bacterium]
MTPSLSRANDCAVLIFSSESQRVAADFPVATVSITLGGFVNRRHQHTIEYLLEENRMLRAKLGRRKLCFTVEERVMLPLHVR